MNDINSYGISGPYGYSNSQNPAMLSSLTRMYTGTGAFQDAGKRAIEVIGAIQALKSANGGNNLSSPPSQA